MKTEETRDEEIIKAAIEEGNKGLTKEDYDIIRKTRKIEGESGNNFLPVEYQYNVAFVNGAEWSDRHPKNPWISVEERLPDYDEEVFAIWGHGEEEWQKPYAALAVRRKGESPDAYDENGFPYGYETYGKPKVIYWQPKRLDFLDVIG